MYTGQFDAWDRVRTNLSRSSLRFGRGDSIRQMRSTNVQTEGQMDGLKLYNVCDVTYKMD